MATILTFDPSRSRRPAPSRSGREPAAGPADVLLFTGVRREPLHSRKSPPAPLHREPMFNDPAPDKPSGKRRRRGKNG